jgi:hypothetical protein
MLKQSNERHTSPGNLIPRSVGSNQKKNTPDQQVWLNVSPLQCSLPFFRVITAKNWWYRRNSRIRISLAAPLVCNLVSLIGSFSLAFFANLPCLAQPSSLTKTSQPEASLGPDVQSETAKKNSYARVSTVSCHKKVVASVPLMRQEMPPGSD